MRFLVFTLFFTLSSIFAFSQNINSCAKVFPALNNDTTVTLQDRDSYTEEVFPTFNVKFEREVAVAIIGNKIYQNVVIEVEAAPFPKEKDYKGIDILVRDGKKKKVYKNSFKSYLYGYGDKSLQMGIDNVLLQMIVFKSEDDQWILFIKEKGIY